MEQILENFPNYKIDEFGNITSVKKNKQLKHSYDTDGYAFVKMPDKDGVVKNVKVHKVVADTFIPNPEDKPTVNHIDLNRKNPVKTNLEWATHVENYQHSINVNGYSGGRLPQACQLTNVVTGEVLTFNRISDAARHIESNKGNVTRAAKENNRTVKGYKVDYV